LDCHHVCKCAPFMMLFRRGNRKKSTSPPYSPDLAPAGARSGEYVFSQKTSPTVCGHINTALRTSVLDLWFRLCFGRWSITTLIHSVTPPNTDSPCFVSWDHVCVCVCACVRFVGFSSYVATRLHY
jgi:hypothetical protein